MVIYLHQDGSAQKVVPERIFQGSNNVIAVDVIAPYAPTTVLEIAFTLPTREQTKYYPMTYVTAVTSGGQTAAAWEYVLSENVTQYAGEVYISINAIDTRGNKTSFAVNFNVERAVLPSLPPAPDPDVYDLLIRYIQQNALNIVKLDKRVTDLENVAIRKVLVDFTVNAVTGAGTKYYSDGTTASVQFPTGGNAPPVKGSWVTVLEFTKDSFNVDNELAFSAQQTGFDNAEYVALLDRKGTAVYEDGTESTPTEHSGYYQTANEFFKGSDGSIYMKFNKSFDGRLVLLGGDIYSGNFIASVSYDGASKRIVFTYMNGEQYAIQLPSGGETVGAYRAHVNGDAWSGTTAPYTYTLLESVHKQGNAPIVFTPNKYFDVSIAENGDITMQSARKIAFDIIVN